MFTTNSVNNPSVAARKRLVELYSSELTACGEGSEVRVGYPTGGGGMKWPSIWPHAADGLHSYRNVLPHEMVFDLGDHTHWIETVANAHAVMDTLNAHGIPYWGALSGGKGFHVHVFGPPRSPDDGSCMNCTHTHVDHWRGGCIAIEPDEIRQCGCIERKPFEATEDDWRVLSSRIILTLASMRKHGTEYGARVQADPLLLAPAFESRQIREFGARKETGDSLGPKTLWTVGPGPYRPLPYNLHEAYLYAHRPAPTAIPRHGKVPFGEWATIRTLFGPACPERPSCLESRCAACPYQSHANEESKETKLVST